MKFTSFKFNSRSFFIKKIFQQTKIILKTKTKSFNPLFENRLKKN